MGLFVCLITLFTVMTLTVMTLNALDGRCTAEERCKCSWSTENLLVSNCSGIGLNSLPTFSKRVCVIDLSNNKLSSLPQRKAIPVTIQYLNLSRNNLETLNMEAFKDMLNLTWLDISYNALHYNSMVFGIQLFQYLKQLKYLNIKRNADVWKRVDTYPVILSELTALEQLLIDGINGARFRKEFKNLIMLDLLDLSGYSGLCNIKALQSDFFQYLPNLKFIDLTRCQLRYIESGVFRRLAFLRTLDLSYNYRLTFRMLENITYDIQFTNLSILSIKKIHCTYGIGTILFGKDMKYLRNSSIQKLYIDSNRLEKTKLEAVQYLPRNLSFLSVSDNKFTIGKYLFLSNSIENLEAIDVSNQNQAHGMSGDIFVDCNDWRCPDNTSNNMNFAKRSTSQNAQKFNFQLPFPLVTFPLPPKLKIFNGYSSSFKTTIGKFNFSKNSLTHAYLQNNSFYYWKGPVMNLHYLEYLDLSYNLCWNVTKFFFADFPSLKVLNISNNNLGLVLNNDTKGEIFQNLSSLLILDLSSNKISILPTLIFKNMRNLRTLKLKFNLLTQWNVKINHMKSLMNLDLSYNQVFELNKRQRNAIDSLVSLHNFTINMTGNTLQCNCETMDFVHWLDSNRRIFPNVERYRCTLTNGSSVHMENAAFMLLKGYCESYIGLISGVLTAVVLSVSIVICGLAYRYRWKIRYLYYVTKSKYKGYSELNKISATDDYDFDAFVSYANEDEIFVTELFINYIEGAGFTLCLHQRDFLPGREIAENITDAIRRSRRTVVILTQNYLRSYWCMFEFNMARMESIYTRGGQNVLFLIFYEKLDPSSLPLTLLNLIETESYLEYPEEEQVQIVFWNKVKEAISRQ